MSIRLYNLSRWSCIPDGEGAFFPNQKQRMVVLECNADGPVSLFCTQSPEALAEDPELKADLEAGREPQGEFAKDFASSARTAKVGDLDRDPKMQLLGHFSGRETIEFGVEGPYALHVMGGDMWYYTADGQDIATRIEDPLIFTRVAIRRERNPHLELIEYQMRQNQRRFREEMQQELDRREKAWEGRYAAQRHQRAVDETTGEPLSKRVGQQQADVEQPGPDDGAGEPAPEKGTGGKGTTGKRAATADTPDS